MTIVVDTNVIAYLYIPGDQTIACERVLATDDRWTAPLLWKSELRNVLALYLRKELLHLPDAARIQAAESLMSGREYDVSSRDVLRLAGESGGSAYDCEFVVLARHLGVPLVTADRRLAGAFPGEAMSPAAFVDAPG